MTYPDAPRLPIVDDLHGHLVHDPYRWLEDASSPRTREWLAAQDELWRRHAAALPGREPFHRRIAELSDTGLVTAPMWRGRRQFFLRRTAGQRHPVLVTVDPSGTERVLLDPTAVDPSGATVLEHWQPDRDGRLVAFQLSRRGDERSELSVLDVDTGTVVDGPIDRCRHSPVAWLPAVHNGGEAFFYVRGRADDPALGRQVWLHRLGAPADDDRPIFGAGRDESTAYGIGLSDDGRWLVVSATRPGARGNDLWIADLTASPVDLRVVQQGVDAATVAHVGRDGRMYVVTTLDAPRGRLCVADPRHPERPHWRELVAADDDTVLTDFAVLDGPRLPRPLLVVGWTRHAVGELTVHDLRTGHRIGEVPLPGAGSVGSLAARPDGGHEVWFTYTDTVTPTTVLRYDATTATTATRIRVDVSGAAERRHGYVSTVRAECVSADGTRVPMVVHSAAGAEAGPRPTILYGYGGFGQALTPTFSSYVLAWVQAGGVFVTANVRGGGEGGEQWHRDGMLERKQNVFDDFVAAAERLVADGWTTPAQLAACGESNGGLLVGAVLTQRPELFTAAVCSAPLLDMVRYERSGLGPSWRGEYGTAADPEQFGWLYGYSPYHRVRAGVDYPAVLFTVFGGDSRVDPMHARKMCAALQWATAGERPVLLRHEDEVGHGARAVDRSVALAADMLAFLAARTGLRVTEPAEPAAVGGRP